MSATMDVVVPVRDVDDYLGEALDSTLDQGVDLMVYVVDAGSRTPIRLPTAHAGRANVRLIRSDEPLLAGGARVLGVQAGSAPWITFLDADDVWPSGSRRALLDACEAAGVGFANGMMTHFHSDADARRLHLPEGEHRALLAGGVVLRRATWDQVGEFDPLLRSGEFIDWYNRVMIAGVPTVEITDTVLRRRVHQKSTTATQVLSADRDDYLEVVRRWMHRND